MSRAEISLILPGLAPIIEQEINRSLLPDSLQKIIKKAGLIQDKSGLERVLFNLFSQQPIDNSDLPIVDLWGIEGAIIKADPCYLHADRDKLLLFSDSLALTEQQSAGLIAEIQPLLTELNMELCQQTVDSWYIASTSQLNVGFSALPDVAGRAIEPFLPEGEDRKQWINLWNEIQMVLHNSAINQQRLADHQLPINSVWFWGQGSFNGKQGVFDRVYGDHALLQQFAVKTGCQYKAIAQLDSKGIDDGKSLFLQPKLDTDSDIVRQLTELEQHVFKPLWQRVNQQKLAQLRVYIPGHGCYQLQPTQRWKFW